MPEKTADITVAHQVERVVSRLDSLSTLPCVATRLFSRLLQSQPSALTDIIESDPALTAKILSLIDRQGLSFTDGRFSVRWALDKLPAQLVRDALFSVRVLQAFDLAPDSDKPLPKKQLAQHSLAVACCARNIAEIVLPQMDSQLAYLAGLLHDIGKLALYQAMPKSFARIVEEAESQNACICVIEQKHLGLDHTILGRRLAQKWHLPSQITLAIWLHHSDTSLISQNMPEAKIAQVVRSADLIARQCDIGQSGSYDVPDSAEQIAQSLAIEPEQLQQIRRNLGEQVGQKSKLLGLDSPNAAAAYCDTVHTTAAQLARDNTKLSLEHRRLQTDSSHLDFITDFLLSIDSATSPIDVAENFAIRWQRFYQTGIVCLYLAPPADSQTLEAVVVENLSQSRMVCLNVPVDSPPIPKTIANSFAILNAHEYVDWLFEQLDVDFDLSQTKLVPLLSAGKAIGAVVFELRYPGDIELFREKFEAATSVAGAVLDMTFSSADGQRFAEQFARFITKPRDTQPDTIVKTRPKDTQPQITTDSSLDALAEMAAGAAHELNNPLSVISGRAQLLTEAETDPEKKRMLEQIRENTGEIAQIVDCLMSFARPQQPRPGQTSIKQILDEATQLAARKQNVEQLDVQIDIADGVENVFVDSAQVVSAIANVFSNSVESYSDQAGPVKVTADIDKSGGFVRLQIADFGCGMDWQTLRKATQPFFSAKPAGRKRGMGLAHARQIVQLNKGSLAIASQPGSGTTVTILLPCK